MARNQVVVVPYPGRGHINPLLNLCHLLSSKLNQNNYNTTIFSVVVTEEWLGFLNPDPVQTNVRFVTIPNVLPSELNRGSNLVSFINAVYNKMEGPFEEMLDKMEVKVDLIIADATMNWPVDVANRRNIPLAAYWPMSATMFSVMHHVDLLESHHHLYVDVSEKGNESIDYIPGISSLKVADIPEVFHGRFRQTTDGIVPNIFSGMAPNLISTTKKADCVLISTTYELESKVIDALRARIDIPVYTSGPNIPYSIPNQTKPNPSSHEPFYLKWLESKSPRTVLYVSLGSFLSVSSAAVDEIVAGLTQSGVNFLWVARGETVKLQEMCGEKGLVVEWCDQLRVLSHSSIGGFWTHCGWNSVKESVFSGVPMLTFPIQFDQPLNSIAIVKDWKIGLKMRKEVEVFKRDKIAELVRQFTDSESVERIEMMERAKKLQDICQSSVNKGGSANKDLDDFIRDIKMYPHY
ncbi:UDP-glucuronosyl/UDP-glucosyltransferase [Artemisia annua]|uniref:UDP-glucuronosyl/UDP-glucosyltransferase n=1 Tax=Artemisia annua TaxID=35608 RepID=A0A2U1L7E5_ARTAN|nr:UDP-glucuronosyl/UDP-glucosyltransferase [Artemisia annua]